MPKGFSLEYNFRLIISARIRRETKRAYKDESTGCSVCCSRNMLTQYGGCLLSSRQRMCRASRVCKNAHQSGQCEVMLSSRDAAPRRRTECNLLHRSVRACKELVSCLLLLQKRISYNL